jgi:hypothetical protein
LVEEPSWFQPINQGFKSENVGYFCGGRQPLGQKKKAIIKYLIRKQTTYLYFLKQVCILTTTSSCLILSKSTNSSSTTFGNVHVTLMYKYAFYFRKIKCILKNGLDYVVS